MNPQRQKGDRGELEVTELLRVVFPSARRRVNGEERQDDKPGRDVQGTPGLCVQVRLAKRPDPVRKLKEAISSALAGETPVAFTRTSSRETRGPGNREPWLVTLRAQDFLRILRSKEHALSVAASAIEQHDLSPLCKCGDPANKHGDPNLPENGTACNVVTCGCGEFDERA